MMADHIDQLYQGDNLVHVGYKNITRVSFQLPKMRCDDQLDVIKNGERLNVDAVRTEKAQCDSSKLNTVMSVSDRPVAKPDVLLTESDRRELPDLILPTAPIYSFDEDGEILQRVNTITPSNSEDCGYHSEPSEALYDDTLPCNISDHVSPPLTSTPNKDLRLDVDSWPRIDQSYVVREASETSVTLPSLHPLISEEELQSLPNIDDTPSESFHLNQPGSVPQDDTEVNIKSIPNITIFSEAGRIDTTEAIPKIDFHAASIEMVDDYLEDNFDEHQLSDLCSTVLGETVSWQVSRPASCRNVVQDLLSAAPQDTSYRRPRVPFHTVVFTERKPSTGDALVLSLGLSADGANTIQDIASKNQGAARERMQQGEMLPSETKLMRQCESCGVSPEDCLKKLGLHSDHVGSLSPSPKSERLVQFFRNLHPVAPRPQHSHTPSGSDPQLDQLQQASSRCQSRSLNTSPTHSQPDATKPRLNTF